MADKKWGFIDSSGNEITLLKFSALEDFNNGLALVEIKDKKGYINSKGIEYFSN